MNREDPSVKKAAYLHSQESERTQDSEWSRLLAMAEEHKHTGLRSLHTPQAGLVGA